ncbi:Uncharacterised protein [Salmonella enterica subsp. enterica serovar Bovismorbificans]|uniref:Uncharacterized protein n=1 Tax=Salmonella enterica subsp. enterica serovar Bovismorbificans TaxID=58097 RepID=A0A655DY08_SALET|nr:Uncharacterised protein [Salmonella enterica subsp. enterica serovar Bovismorbificans]
MTHGSTLTTGTARARKPLVNTPRPQVAPSSKNIPILPVRVVACIPCQKQHIPAVSQSAIIGSSTAYVPIL